MKQYLIIECAELCDQYECDCDRTPILVTSDEKIAKSYGLGYEIWEIDDNGELKRTKEYENALEEGMAFYYWSDSQDPEEDEPTIVKKWPNKTRKDSIPKEVWNFFKEKNAHFVYTDTTKQDFCDEVRNTGASSFYFHDTRRIEYYAVYGEYRDDHFDCGY